jgi:8-oxo-dGTP pyrophosphatase MutT (NUDIX family)
MQSDGDGWVQCALGHRHWGRFGAAGLLISDGRRVVLQHRAPWTHEGGQWGLPGGARDSHEDPTGTALREANEEAAIDAELIDPIATWVDDHGGWSYTSVLARPSGVGEIAPHAANAESTDVRWCTHDEVAELALHRGLAATWPRLRDARAALSIIVDTRAGQGFGRIAEPASLEHHRLESLARHGVPTTTLPLDVPAADVSAVLARIIVVGPTPVTADPSRGQDERWWRRAIVLTAAPADIDAELVERAELTRWRDQVVVVTDSSAVRAKLLGTPDVSLVGSDWLIEQLQRHASG